MKKNEVINEVENMIINGDYDVVDQETMQQIIEDNMHIVPKNQLKKFKELTIEEQYKKLQYYQDRAVKVEAWRQSAKVVNKVKEVFEKRHATIDDAREVLKFAQEYIDNFKQRQIEDIDKQIQELEELKASL